MMCDYDYAKRQKENPMNKAPNPKVRKTYVVSYVDDFLFVKQIYCQTYRQAQKEQARVRKEGHYRNHISYWIDGAEMLRLARLGFEYDQKKGKAVLMKHYPRKFIKMVDAMLQEERDVRFLDYRNFKTSDDVVAFHNRKRAE